MRFRKDYIRIIDSLNLCFDLDFSRKPRKIVGFKKLIFCFGSILIEMHPNEPLKQLTFIFSVIWC